MPQLIAPALVAGLGMSAGSASLAAGIIFTVGSGLLQLLTAPDHTPPDGAVAIKQSVPPRTYGYGRDRVSGAVVCHESFTSKGDMLKVQGLASHRCHQFVSYFLHDDQGQLDGSGYFQGGPGRRYGKDKDRVKIDTRLGLVPETAYADIVSRTSVWTNDHRGDGICSISYVAGDSSASSQAKDYPFGAPLLSAEVDLALVYDPREVGQDPDDESTWAWSDNPVLCLLHYHCFSEFGYQRPYATAILPHVESWKAQADLCDAAVALAAGGTEPRYRYGGSYTTEQAQRAVLGQMLASCDGWLVETGDGGVDIRVGVFEAPGIILTDDDIVGFDLQYGIADEEVVNRLELTFTDPDQKYAEIELDPWEDEADQAVRGMVREHRFPLKGVRSPTQARRLGKRENIRLKERLRGTLDVRLDRLDAVRARWVRVQSATIPQLADKVIENRGGHLSLLAGSVRVAFIGSGSHIDDWTPEDDEGDLPTVPEVLAGVEGTEPQNVTIEYINYSLVYEGATEVIDKGAIRVVFDDDGLTQHFEVRWSWTEQLGDGPIEQTRAQVFTLSDQVKSGGTITLLVFDNIPAVEELSVQVAGKSPNAYTYTDFAPDPATMLDTRNVPTTVGDGFELREDGGVELREDGFKELRERDNA